MTSKVPAKPCGGDAPGVVGSGPEDLDLRRDAVGEHDVLAECGALGVTPEAVAAALEMDPQPAAVLLTRPSYYGLARDLHDVAALCHRRKVPLIIDEAHGAHFQWLPKGGPEPALAALRDPKLVLGPGRVLE